MVVTTDIVSSGSALHMLQPLPRKAVMPASIAHGAALAAQSGDCTCCTWSLTQWPCTARGTKKEAQLRLHQVFVQMRIHGTLGQGARGRLFRTLGP